MLIPNRWQTRLTEMGNESPEKNTAKKAEIISYVDFPTRQADLRIHINCWIAALPLLTIFKRNRRTHVDRLLSPVKRRMTVKKTIQLVTSVLVSSLRN